MLRYFGFSFIEQKNYDGRRDLQEGAAAKLDFNPIEMAFAKLKAILRAVAARNRDDLWQAVGDAIPEFSADECRNYFTAAGYGST